MISIQSPEVRERIAGWQSELRKMTKDETVQLHATRKSEVRLTLEQVGEIVLHVTGIPYEELQVPNRKRTIAHTRQLIAYFARNVCGTSWRVIGEYIGGKDHTTAMHGYKCISDLLETENPATITAVSKINLYLDEVRHRIGNKKTN